MVSTLDSVLIGFIIWLQVIVFIKVLNFWFVPKLFLLKHYFQVIIPPKPSTFTPNRSPEKVPEAKKQRGQGSLRLVSYNDDTVISDDENVSPNRETVSMDISEEEIDPAKATPIAEPSIDKYAHYGFSLPPEAKGKVPQELHDKIIHLYEKMRTTNMDMNKVIQERKEFRNPSIYEKLIQFCDINELGTNYPPEIYDPLQWGPESYYEELAKAQKVEMLKRQKERKENDKEKAAEEEAKKR